MRHWLLFLPAVVIPLTFQIISSGQPFSTATVNTPQSRFPPLKPLPQPNPVAPKVYAQKPLTSAKTQAQKVIASKQSLKAKSSNNEATPRPYTAPAIKIRVAIAQNVSSIAIASSTAANIIDGNGQVLEPLPPNQSIQISAHSSSMLFQDWDKLIDI